MTKRPAPSFLAHVRPCWRWFAIDAVDEDGDSLDAQFSTHKPSISRFGIFGGGKFVAFCGTDAMKIIRGLRPSKKQRIFKRIPRTDEFVLVEEGNP